jgi:hypothetical protein
VQDREVIVTMSHVSIEANKIDHVVLMCSHSREYKEHKIIFGMDVWQRLSGGALKLAAFDKLLSDYKYLSAVLGPACLFSTTKALCCTRYDIYIKQTLHFDGRKPSEPVMGVPSGHVGKRRRCRAQMSRGLADIRHGCA